MRKLLINGPEEFVKVLIDNDCERDQIENELGIEFSYPDGIFPSDESDEQQYKREEDGTNDWGDSLRVKETNYMPTSYPCLACWSEKWYFDVDLTETTLDNFLGFVYESDFTCS